jgi:cell division protein FtsX
VSRPILFLSRELLASSRRAGWALALWVLALALTLAAGTSLLLLPAGGRPDEPRTEAAFLAALAADLSDEGANELAWELWSHPQVAQVNFRFPGEEGAPQDKRALLVKLTSPRVRDEVQGLLSSLPGIEDISYFERTIKPPPRLPLLARILALAGLALAGAAALLFGRLAVRRVAAAWERAISLLRAAGLPERRLRAPFLVLGALAGLAGGAIYAGLLWGALVALGDSQAIRTLVPSFPDCGPLATGVGLAAGIGLGMLGSLLGFPTRAGRKAD